MNKRTNINNNWLKKLFFPPLRRFRARKLSISKSRFTGTSDMKRIDFAEKNDNDSRGEDQQGNGKSTHSKIQILQRENIVSQFTARR